MLFTFFTFLTTAAAPPRAVTLFGWTPGLRTLLTARALACGCVVGIYEDWSGRRVSIVDVAHDTCAHGHAMDDVVPGGG